MLIRRLHITIRVFAILAVAGLAVPHGWSNSVCACEHSAAGAARCCEAECAADVVEVASCCSSGEPTQQNVAACGVGDDASHAASAPRNDRDEDVPRRPCGCPPSCPSACGVGKLPVAPASSHVGLLDSNEVEQIGTPAMLAPPSRAGDSIFRPPRG